MTMHCICYDIIDRGDGSPLVAIFLPIDLALNYCCWFPAKPGQFVKGNRYSITVNPGA